MCLLFGVSAQAVKQDLRDVFTVYQSFASELGDQNKQLLEKLEQASYLPGCYGDEVQSKYQQNTIKDTPLRSGHAGGSPV